MSAYILLRLNNSSQWNIFQQIVDNNIFPSKNLEHMLIH